ncbi:MAG: hypothetical protein AB7K36_29930 [Chloroflexota bacterium]
MSTEGRRVIPVHVIRTKEGRLARALLAGFAASFAMLLAFVLAYTVSRLIAAVVSAETGAVGTVRLWLHNLTHNQLMDAGRSDVFVTTAIYLLGGLVWAILYTVVAEPRLVGPGWLRGLVFAAVPTVFSVIVFLPLVGGGVFGIAFDAGPLPMLGNFILHAVYGVVLGELYGPFGSLDATTLGTRGDVALGTQSGAELMAARGLIGGLLVGLGVGIVATLVAGVPIEGRLLGQPVVALLLGSSGIGAAFGSTVGAFVGLDGHYDLPARP